MDSFVQVIIDFIEVRQINFAVAAVLTIGYLLYQYRGTFLRKQAVVLHDSSHSMHKMSNPYLRSRSKSRHSYREDIDVKHGRGRRPHRRCPDCSKCNLDYSQ